MCKPLAASLPVDRRSHLRISRTFLRSAMAAYTVAPPLCTWLVAACISAASDTDAPSSINPLRWPRRRRRRQAATRFPAGRIPTFYGSAFRVLPTSCEDYSSSTPALFGECGSRSLFGTKIGTSTDRQRRRTNASPATAGCEICIVSFFLFSFF